MTTATGGRKAEAAGRESELRAAARKRGLTLKELARRMEVSTGYLSQIANGHKPWTDTMREKATELLGEVPGQGTVSREGGSVSGESSHIREQARTYGMSMQDLAERVGVSHGYLSQVSRGRTNMGVKLQARLEATLGSPAKVGDAACAGVDSGVLWDRMDAHEISQNEVARRAGISASHMSNIVNGNVRPSPHVLKKLHGVLFRRATTDERVTPAEVRVLGWRKGERTGTVVRGARGRDGTAGGGAVRIGGHVPWGAEVEYAYSTGYDGAGRVSMDPIVAPPVSALLMQPEAAAA